MDYTKIIRDIMGARDVASKDGIDAGEFTKGIGAALPEILSQISNNARIPEEKESLEKALRDHEDDNIENPKEYVEQFDNDESSRMLDKIFGGRKEVVEKEVVQKTGLDQEKIRKILMIAAPLILAHLANSRKKDPNFEVEKSTKKMEKEVSGGLFESLGKIFDKDGDGNILNDFLKF